MIINKKRFSQIKISAYKLKNGAGVVKNNSR